MTIIPQVEIIIIDGTALPQWKDKPPHHINHLKTWHRIPDFLQSVLITYPVDLAHHVEDVDRDPDQEVANGREDDELLKEQVVKR